MLLITRRVGESIIVNGDIELKIVDVRGGRVKLGFEYPEGNTVYRKELYMKIQEENEAAATSFGRIDSLIKDLTKKEE